MSRNLTISSRGERLDLEVRQGSTLGPMKHMLANPDDTPLDLTGVSIQGKVRLTPDAYGPALADIVITWPSDRTLGYYEFGVPAEIMATFPERAYYDMDLTDSQGRVLPLFYGEFRVTREAARPDTIAPVVATPTC